MDPPAEELPVALSEANPPAPPVKVAPWALPPLPPVASDVMEIRTELALLAEAELVALPPAPPLPCAVFVTAPPAPPQLSASASARALSRDEVLTGPTRAVAEASPPTPPLPVPAMTFPPLPRLTIAKVLGLFAHAVAVAE